VIEFPQVHSFEVVLVDLKGRLEDCQIDLWSPLPQLYFIDNDKDLPEIEFVLVVIAHKLLVDLPRNLSVIS
jgi:hypothetical protein